MTSTQSIDSPTRTPTTLTEDTANKPPLTTSQAAVEQQLKLLRCVRVWGFILIMLVLVNKSKSSNDMSLLLSLVCLLPPAF